MVLAEARNSVTIKPEVEAVPTFKSEDEDVTSTMTKIDHLQANKLGPKGPPFIKILSRVDDNVRIDHLY